jgi:hypothetical protein
MDSGLADRKNLERRPQDDHHGDDDPGQPSLPRRYRHAGPLPRWRALLMHGEFGIGRGTPDLQEQ